jgi:hypothetical protein
MAGRPTLYSDIMHQSAIDYIEGGYEKEKHPFPSAVGMAVTLNVAKSTLYQWADDNRNGKHGQFSDTLDQCNDYQELNVMNGSITNVLNPTISKLVLANFGYHDKQDINADVTAKDKSREELEAKLRAAGLNPEDY